jgi:hypothetical protein
MIPRSPVIYALMPDEVSSHPEAETWLPVLVAYVETADRWTVRCPECGRPNSHTPEPGFRNAQCHCEGMRERRQISGYVIAPPGAQLAPYPDHCSRCRRERGRVGYIYTPVDLRASDSGRGLIAGYICDSHHGWETGWGDSPRPERAAVIKSSPGGGRRCVLYRHYDSTGVLLYVGISERPGRRTGKHAEESGWVPFAVRMDAQWFDNRATATAMEKQAIRAERPVFNRQHAVGDPERRIAAYIASRSR